MILENISKGSLDIEDFTRQWFLEQISNTLLYKGGAPFTENLVSIINAFKIRDPRTCLHSLRVSTLSAAISEFVEMDPSAKDVVWLAGLLHDIGKLGVGESALHKVGQLSSEEYSDIARHSGMGEHYIAPIVASDAVQKAIRHHHERYDGSGYPDQLLGEEIPIVSRILAVADAYDAMTSERLYRKASSIKFAINEINLKRGSQFDSAVVDAFFKVMKDIQNTEVEWSNPCPATSKGENNA